MAMLKFIKQVRRDLAVAAGVREGEKLQRYRAARAGIDADLWPHDAAQFDQMIDQLERRQQARLQFLKTTA